MPNPAKLFLSCLAALLCSAPAPAQTVPAGAFRVGAAKVDVTPEAADLPKSYLGVLDHIYARAVVIDNGHDTAALISLDAGAVPSPVWDDVSQRLNKELGITPDHVLITATHTHSVPMGMRIVGGVPVPNPPSKVYEDRIVDAARQAKQSLQPARISYGTGLSFLNVQRDIIDPGTHRWWEGANYDGLSDKTVAVIKFEALDGKPIAVYYNYAMHAVITGTLDLVSGDIPGATSRYIESHYQDKVVALWSEGAAGDQNPIYFQQTYDLRDIRVKDYASRGQDISNAMPPGGEGLDRRNPQVLELMNEQKEMITSMGQLLGEEVLRVMRDSKISDAEGRIFGSSKVVQCPGRVRTNEGRGGYAGTYKDGSPVDLRLGLLMVDNIAIGAVDGEVYNEIAQRLKRESPFKQTMLATLTDGMAKSGYIPDDASFGHYTFEVLSSRLQPGCAESSIVDGIVSMMPHITY